MATFDYGDFFVKARKIDPETRQPVHPDLYTASKTLKKRPLTGNGSRGGGYICVCDYCGQAFHTYTKNRKFCDTNCKARYASEHRKPAYISRMGQLHGIVTRRCECCGNTFEIKHSFLYIGRGVFCSVECYHKMRPLQAQWFVCNRCGTQFKALSDRNSKFCCNECDKLAPRYDDNDAFFNYEPILRDNESETALRCKVNNRVILEYKNEIKRIFRDSTPNRKDLPKLRIASILEIESQINEENEIHQRNSRKDVT